MKRIDEMKKQQKIIAEEKRKIVDDIKRKKKDMLEELEIKLHKGKLNKDEFYNKLNNILGKTGMKTEMNVNNTSKFASGSQQLENGDLLQFDEDNIFDINDKNTFIGNNSNSNKEIHITKEIGYSPIKSDQNNNSTLDELKMKLDHKLYDLIAKCNIEESHLIQQINSIEDTSEKQRKEEELILLKERNEKAINTLKEENKKMKRFYNSNYSERELKIKA